MLKTLYHGTTLKRLHGITEQEWIIPQAMKGAGKGGTDVISHLYEGFTFFATSKSVAGEYALWKNRNSDEICVILEVKLPEDILLPDDNDCPLAKEWSESAKKIGQVKVWGNVSVRDISNIYFYDEFEKGYLFDLFELQYSNWQMYFDEKLQTIYHNRDKETEYHKNLYIQDLLNNNFIIENNQIKNQTFKSVYEIYKKHYPYHSSFFNGSITENGDILIDIEPSDEIDSEKSFGYWTERNMYLSYWNFENSFLGTCAETPRLYDNLNNVFGNIEMYFAGSMSCFIHDIPECLKEYDYV